MRSEHGVDFRLARLAGACGRILPRPQFGRGATPRRSQPCWDRDGRGPDPTSPDAGSAGFDRMAQTHSTPSIVFVIGAGFSKCAGILIQTEFSSLLLAEVFSPGARQLTEGTMRCSSHHST
jgi:hypothetical protein